jgi:hypothetical protein
VDQAFLSEDVKHWKCPIPTCPCQEASVATRDQITVFPTCRVHGTVLSR